MFRVQKASLNMWEYSPSLVNLASDWLRAEGSLVDEEEIKIKIDDGVTWYFIRFGGIFFTCSLVGGASLYLGPRII